MMRPFTRRGVAAAAAAIVAAVLVPLTAGPASAAVTLTGPSNPAIDTAATYTFNTGASFIIEPGTYCLASTPSSRAPLVSVPTTVPANKTTANLMAAFPDPGTYTIGMVPALIGGAPCPGSAEAAEFVSGASATVSPVTTIGNITVTPARVTNPVGGIQSFSVALVGPTGTPIPFRPVIVASAGRNPSAPVNKGNTNAAGTLVFTWADVAPAASMAFSDTLTIASTDAAMNVIGTQAYITYLPSGSLTVTPTSATAAPGASTSFTVTLKDAMSNPVNGAAVFMASTGRNTFGARGIGFTNAIGQRTWALTDTAPATSTATTDTVTFSAAGKSVTATVSYTGMGTLVASPATATASFGAATSITVTLTNGSGAPVPGVAVTVSGTGRNAFAATSAGTTNASGQVVWNQPDAAGAGVTTPTQSVLTFSASGLTATSTITYGAPSGTVTITSPADGSAISSGGYFNVHFTTTGVPDGSTAFLTLNGSAKSQITVGPGSYFTKIPAEEGTYAVRIGGGSSGPVLATSAGFQLTIIPFQLNGRSGTRFTVLPGNFSAGTLVYLTRNSATIAARRIPTKGVPFTITAVPAAGVYQVWVASNQGRVYGAHAGVITIG